MNYENTYQLVEAIANILQISKTKNIENKVALYTMMLPDKLYQRLFQTLSSLLNEKVTDLHKLFVEQVVSINLLKNNIRCVGELSSERSDYNLKEAHIRKQSANSLQVQNEFVAALIQALSNKGFTVPQSTNNRRLCEMVNEHLKDNFPLDFWTTMRNIIPQKTEIQLREYYQKSFSRHMFEESISVQDKIILCDLMNEMPNEKPSKIAAEFVKMVGTGKYFYRNIVMYIVNKK
ncbi:Hypothetical_protein [Hexamita inflata]|uniref:Hypothetical_protein n=1 Tax=Hexamita inflata TaxID=28002 RepID=A0AA86TJI5_9EUKA|nr:Hypothetical protein HINF_LOCUS8264 [Hexamita inflata]